MLKFIIIFSLCSLVNVMLNTVKTIIMYRQEKLSSSLINAITYGFYTVIVVLMSGDMDLWIKIIVTAVTNFIGVWLSMLIVEKMRKDKLWKIEVSVSKENNQDDDFEQELNENNMSYSMVRVFNDNYRLFHVYCPTQSDSIKAKNIIKKYKAKYFVSESKTL